MFVWLYLAVVDGDFGGWRGADRGMSRKKVRDFRLIIRGIDLAKYVGTPLGQETIRYKQIPRFYFAQHSQKSSLAEPT